MAGQYLTEGSEWSPGITEFEETDFIQGGPDGIDNLPHKELAARTNWLKARFALKVGRDYLSAEVGFVEVNTGLDFEQYRVQFATMVADVDSDGSMGDVFVTNNGAGVVRLHRTGEFYGDVRWLVVAVRVGG